MIGCAPWARPSTKPQAIGEHERKTLAAIADTFLPGDDGTPGAHEVNALATIVDPAYGLDPYIHELVSDLDQWCVATKFKGFIGLQRADREKALEQRMGLHGKAIKSLYAPAYEGILALTKLAYFGALHSKLGTNYLAFPTASRGYAPGSAAGAWASREAPWAIGVGKASRIRVDGAGAASEVKLSAFVTTDDDVKAVARVHAPDGKSHDVKISATDGQAWIHDLALPIVGGPAAGDWRFEIAALLGGSGRIEMWSIQLRTDLDDKA
jgi:hypothetical protein